MLKYFVIIDFPFDSPAKYLEHGKMTLENFQWLHGFSVLEQRSGLHYFLIKSVPSSFLAVDISPPKCDGFGSSQQTQAR